MTLEIATPSASYEENGVEKVVAEDGRGYFCLLEHHIDYVTALVPGIVTFQKASGIKAYYAVDEGLLLKKGDRVTVAVKNAFKSDKLEELDAVVKSEYEKVETVEKKAREILVRLESEVAGILLENE